MLSYWKFARLFFSRDKQKVVELEVEIKKLRNSGIEIRKLRKEREQLEKTVRELTEQNAVSRAKAANAISRNILNYLTQMPFGWELAFISEEGSVLDQSEAFQKKFEKKRISPEDLQYLEMNLLQNQPFQIQLDTSRFNGYWAFPLENGLSKPYGYVICSQKEAMEKVVASVRSAWKYIVESLRKSQQLSAQQEHS